MAGLRSCLSALQWTIITLEVAAANHPPNEHSSMQKAEVTACGLVQTLGRDLLKFAPFRAGQLNCPL